jgi:hypothetical protein
MRRYTIQAQDRADWYPFVALRSVDLRAYLMLLESVKGRICSEESLVENPSGES